MGDKNLHGGYEHGRFRVGYETREGRRAVLRDVRPALRRWIKRAIVTSAIIITVAVLMGGLAGGNWLRGLWVSPVVLFIARLTYCTYVERLLKERHQVFVESDFSAVLWMARLVTEALVVSCFVGHFAEGNWMYGLWVLVVAFIIALGAGMFGP